MDALQVGLMTKRPDDLKEAADAFVLLIPEIQAMGSPAGFIASGGMPRWEREAAKAAVEAVRRQWLDVLERFDADVLVRYERDPDSVDWREVVAVSRELRRLRRALGIKPTPETRREQTLRRVRAYRERKRKA